MNIKELNNELRTKAIASGLCKQWQEEWKNDWDTERMIRQFYRGLDFFLKHRFINNDFIIQNFSLEFRRDNGIMVDDKFSLLNTENAILLGNSDISIRVNGFKASHIYVLDNSKAKITAKNRSFVIVHTFDNAEIEAKAYDMARLVVINHSHDTKLNLDDSVIVKEEFEYLNS